MREHQQLSALELPGLAQHLAQDVLADRLDRAQAPASLAGRAGVAELALEALARALARHLDEPERRDRRDAGLRVVRRQRLTQRGEDPLAVRDILHVDEVDDDDAAQVAQPQLAREGDGGLQVGAQDGVVEVAMPDEAAGVHIDGRHRLGLVDDQIAARFERHLALERAVDLLLDAVQIEDRPRRGMQFQTRRLLRQEVAHEGLELRELRGVVHQHALDAAREFITQHAPRQRQILVHELARRRAETPLAHLRPQAFEIIEVRGEQRGVHALGGGAHDVAAGMPLRDQRLHRSAQPQPLGLVLDAGGYADAAAARHEDEIARRQRDEGRQPSAFRAHRILDHLHEQVVAGVHEPPDVQFRRGGTDT